MRYYLAVALISLAIVAYQIALIRILSIMQWYHFAYMVISVALLGFGASGSFISLFRETLLRHFSLLFPLLLMLAGVAMMLAVPLAQSPSIRFDSYLLFARKEQLVKLLATYLFFFIPFFLGALAIGLTFMRFVDSIGKMYFANLLGSGLGGIVAVLLSWVCWPQQLTSIFALTAILAGVVVISRRTYATLATLALVSAGIGVWLLLYPASLQLSQFKSLTTTLNLPEAHVVAEHKSPEGWVQEVYSPALRYAPGLSLAYQGTVPSRGAIFSDGNWYGPSLLPLDFDTANVLTYTTQALPYTIYQPEKVLVLQSGTGHDLAYAYSQGADEIIGVESNPGVLSLARPKLNKSGIKVFEMFPRTFLARDTAFYDLVIFPAIDAFGGTSGLHAINEQYLFTREALAEALKRLTPQGMLSLSCWLDHPSRSSLKLMATLKETLNQIGLKYPKQHLVAVRSWGNLTILVKRTPFSAEEIHEVRAFCQYHNFDPLLLSGIRPEERSRYHVLQDNRYFSYVDQLWSEEGEVFLRNYDFHIVPATDNRPYFSRFLKLGNLNRLSALYGASSIPFLELGYLIVLLTLIQVVLAAIILIILPLFRIGWKGERKAGVFFYFAAIGIGFMFVEMVFIQRFILFFGNPVYATAAVITVLLVFSGMGSYMTSQWKISSWQLKAVFATIVGILVVYAFFVPSILRLAVVFPLVLKLVALVLLLAPIAFLMGIPFPTGLRWVNQIKDIHVPWAWGVNGCFSVISAVLATVVAVEWGFLAAMLLAAGAYSILLWIKVEF